MMRVSIGDLLEVGWRDCQAVTNGALRDVETAAAVNIGWLARIDSTTIVLANGIYPDTPSHEGDYTAIPTGWITSVRVIEEAAP